MDLEKIKKAAAVFGAADYGVPMPEHVRVAKDVIAAAVPEMAREIERLRALAREGWQAARDAWETEDFGNAERIEKALKEIEATS